MLELEVNGKVFSHWLSAKIVKSLQSFSGSFDVTYTTKVDKKSPSFLIKEGDECTVKYKSKSIVTGFIEKASLDISETSISFSCAGRDKTGDLVDSQVSIDEREFKNQSIVDISNKLCSDFGISFKSESQNATSKIKNIVIDTKDTIAQIIAKLSKLKNCIVLPNDRGELVFTKIGSKNAGSLTFGQFLSVKIEQDSSQKFQTYKAYFSDNCDADNKHKKEIASVKDSSVKRPRVLILEMPKATLKEDAINKLKWEMCQRIAKAISITIVTDGWLNSQKNLWEPNQLLTLDLKSFGISETFLIESCMYSLDNNGYSTELKLVLKDAYEAEETKNGKGVL